MRDTVFDKRIFTSRTLFADLGFLLGNIPALMRARRNPDLGRALAGKIMMVVTAINGCTYCTWFHAKEAAESGMSDEEISNMFNLQFEASATPHELPALLYAQHYTENDRMPDPQMTARLVEFYGEQTAHDVMLMIRVIYFGNLLGNTFDAFPARLKGQGAKESSALFEALFWLATFWLMLPAKWWLSRSRNDRTQTAPEGTDQ